MKGGNQFTNPVTQEELDFLKENRPYYTIDKLTKLLNEKFGKRRNPGFVKTICRKKLKIHKEYQKLWTTEEDEWLKANYKGKTREQLVETFNEYFNEKRTPQAIKLRFNRDLGLKLDNDNIGHKMAGEKRKCPNGAKLKTYFGYTLVKTDDGYISYGRYLWETTYKEKLLSNEYIIFLDGNNENYDISNLRKVSRGIHIKLNKHGWQYKGKLTDAFIEILKTEEILNDR